MEDRPIGIHHCVYVTGGAHTICQWIGHQQSRHRTTEEYHLCTQVTQRLSNLA
jgi:hypothetical protein